MFKSLKKVLVGVLASSLVLSSVVFAAGSATDAPAAKEFSKAAKKATVTLKFKKVKGIKKYEVEYSLKKNFKKSTVKTAKKTTYTIKNLKKGKKYYVRVRATKTNYAGNAIYSKWVKKSVKTKK